MGSYHHFYPGTNYNFSPEIDSIYGEPINKNLSVSQIAQVTNPQTANQLKAASDTLSTGVKNVELSWVSPDVEKAIPEQHLTEINRLKKLVGAELTLHAPIIEPTGINPQAGAWDPFQREQAEKQMWNSVKRAHKLDPEGNIVITLHSSAGLPDPRTKIITEDGKEVSTNLAVINERTGRFGSIPAPTEDYLEGKKPNIDEGLEEINKQEWAQNLVNVNITATRANQALEEAKGIRRFKELKEIDSQGIYNKAKSNPDWLNSLEQPVKENAEQIIENMEYGNLFAREAYTGLNQAFNIAYGAAKTSGDKSSLNKLNKLKEELSPHIDRYEKDKTKVNELRKAVAIGLAELDSLKTPQIYKPLETFAVDKASETFSNVAFKGYKEFGKTAPVITIENPPAGMGIYRAEELKELIEKTKEKFVQKVMKEKRLSKSEAQNQADKLIGATWDVGHINMLRKYGYENKHLEKQTKTIAPYVKKIHLSDNFGFDHSELPMGMGNVPMKAHEKLLKQYGKKVDQIKRVIEAGDWIQHFGATPPLVPTLEAFGSPIYAMDMAPHWNQIAGISGGYPIGMGQMLPNVNFQTYGAGFSNLPVELGGQMAGQSRLSGAPIE